MFYCSVQCRRSLKMYIKSENSNDRRKPLLWLSVTFLLLPVPLVPNKCRTVSFLSVNIFWHVQI